MANREWRILVGCQYPPDEDRRREPGEIVSDIPAWLAKVLRADGVIEPAKVEHDEDDEVAEPDAPAAIVDGEMVTVDDATVHNTKAKH